MNITKMIMRLVFISALLASLLSGFAASSQVNHTISKRWYSQQDDKVVGPWPKTDFKCAPKNEMWRPVRYCYNDVASATSLEPLVKAAIEKWRPAMEQTALDIIPACLKSDGSSPDPCLCSLLEEPVDALVISSVTTGGTRTTMGFDYVNRQHSRRHWMNVQYPLPATARSLDEWALTVAHEFGHAIGLGHEHQRSDRDDYVEFTCDNLYGFNTARRAVRTLTKNGQFPDCAGKTDYECMDDVICVNPVAAAAHFPAALQFIKDGPEDFINMVYSGPFDYDSIMIYGSYDGARNTNPNFPNDAVLVGLRPGPNDGKYNQLFYGGNRDLTKAGISAGDLARVAQLYNKGTPEGDAAKNLPTWAEVPRVPAVEGGDTADNQADQPVDDGDGLDTREL